MQIKNIILAAVALAVANATPIAQNSGTNGDASISGATPVNCKAVTSGHVPLDLDTCARQYTNFNKSVEMGSTPSTQEMDLIKNCDSCFVFAAYIKCFEIKGKSYDINSIEKLSEIPEEVLNCYKEQFKVCNPKDLEKPMCSSSAVETPKDLTSVATP